MIGFETFCRIQSFLSWIQGGGGWDAFLFANGNFFLDFFFSWWRNLPYTSIKGKSLEVHNVLNLFRLALSESGDVSWFFLNQVQKWSILIPHSCFCRRKGGEQYRRAGGLHGVRFRGARRDRGQQPEHWFGHQVPERNPNSLGKIKPLSSEPRV